MILTSFFFYGCDFRFSYSYAFLFSLVPTFFSLVPTSSFHYSEILLYGSNFLFSIIIMIILPFFSLVPTSSMVPTFFSLVLTPLSHPLFLPNTPYRSISDESLLMESLLIFLFSNIHFYFQITPSLSAS